MSGNARPLLAGLLTGGLIVAYDGLAHYVSAVPDAAPWAALVTLLPAAAFGLSLLFKRYGWLPTTLGGLLMGGLAMQLWPLLRDNLTWLYLAQYLSTNVALGLYFGRSLGAGQTPACTTFAAMVHPTVTPTLRHYTRRVTQVWTIFFFASAALSALLYFLAPAEVWSLFSNVFYLPSLAVMFLVEGLVRRRALPPEDRHGVIASIRAYQASTQRNSAQP
jgi:uncharacterized membrane protein